MGMRRSPPTWPRATRWSWHDRAGRWRFPRRLPSRSECGAVTAVVALAGVVKEYPGSPPVRAVDGIDLTIDDGEFVAIVGPSGSGKSTLLQLVGLLDRPTSGEVLLDGEPVDALSDAERTRLRLLTLGFVFQRFHLLPGVTAVEN